MADRAYLEDALKEIYRLAQSGQAATPADLARQFGWPTARAAEVATDLNQAGLAAPDAAGGLVLTNPGRDYALSVVRAHRLYETYLAQRTGLQAGDWHEQAHAAEHDLTSADVERMSRALGNPRYDPHGDPIPTAEGEMPPERGWLLTEASEGWAGRIVHVEDEPPAVYTKLNAAGFAPDVRLRVDETAADRLLIRIVGHTVELTPEEASQVKCDDLRPGERYDDTVVRLSDLRPGQRGEIVGISPLIRGLARSRLLDLGVVPGTTLSILLLGPSGDPVSYDIRGANIALRSEQSERIFIRRQSEAA